MDGLTSDPAGAMACIDVLIDGLRVSDRRHNEFSSAAIRELGPLLLPGLRSTASEPKIGKAHKRRLDAAILSAETAAIDPIATSPNLVIDAIMDALRVNDKNLHQKALRAIQLSFPPRFIGRIITTASINGANRDYCARLLFAAELLDGIPEASQRLDLMILTGHSDLRVRCQAMRLVEIGRASCRERV